MEGNLGLAAAFLLGLFGSLHCVGMCGGIVGTLSMGATAPGPSSNTRLWLFQLLYNAGRVGSYMIAGALAAWAGASLQAHALPRFAHVGAYISAAFMFALGLYLAGWTGLLTPIERGGWIVWRRIEPIGRRLLPVRHPLQALALGLVWGWLPCGMVYAIVAWALTAPGPLDGALLMAAFGLGTLPMLLLLGGAASRLAQLTRHPIWRRTVGLLIIAFAVYSVLAPAQHQHAGLEQSGETSTQDHQHHH